MNQDRVMVGIAGLDKMLRGGLIRGRNILLSGPCGVGKTTLAVQFLVTGVRSGEKTLYVTLEESKDKIFADMQKFGFDLGTMEKEGKLLMIGGPLSNVKKFMKDVDAGTDSIILEIEKTIRSQNISRVVIDSINLFTMLLNNDNERRQQLAVLCNSLSTTGATVLLITEAREGTLDVSTYGIEEFIADGVLALFRMQQGQKFINAVLVRKMRGSDHDRELRLYKITHEGISVYPDEPLFAQMAQLPGL